MKTPVYTKEDLEQFKKHPRITSAKLKKSWTIEGFHTPGGSGVMFRTDSVYLNLYDYETKVRLGKLGIHVGYQNRNSYFCFQVENRRKWEDYGSHPNCYSLMCLGGYHTPIQKAYNEKDIPTLIELSFVCLENWNPRDSDMEEEDIIRTWGTEAQKRKYC